MTEDEIKTCPCCGQVIINLEDLKLVRTLYNTYQRDYKRKKRLEAKLAKDVKPLTNDDMKKISTNRKL